MEAFKPTVQIRKFAEILNPEKSDPPVLSPEIRAILRQWIVEMGSEEELASLGIKPRRTAILSGPPGCGKTTLAHHFAARIGVPLVVVNMASIVSKYFGESGQNINAIFDSLHGQEDSCVLFLDEFDSVATKRNDVNQERNGIVIALLQRIDIFRGTIIAATNMPDNIDPAIWRRFSLHLDIREPNDDERFAILSRYLSPLSLADDDMDVIVKVTSGASPSLLKQAMESIKRDYILSPKYEQNMDVKSAFKRLIFSVCPHSDAIRPPLWKESWALEEVNKIQWPPVDSRVKL